MQYHQSESHHKELAACTDEQLCAMAAAGDREAEELLVTRYYGMVRACARPLFLAGGDGEDLIQEGMFGLIRANVGSMTLTRRRRFTPMQDLHSQRPVLRAPCRLPRQALSAERIHIP